MIIQCWHSVFNICCRSKVNTLLIDYAMKGFSTHHYPISDEQIPSMMHCSQIIEDIHATLLKGRKVLIQ